MAVTIEDLYRNYGILADASKDNLGQVNKATRVHFQTPFNRELRCFAAAPHFTSTVINFVDITLLCAC